MIQGSSSLPTAGRSTSTPSWQNGHGDDGDDWRCGGRVGCPRAFFFHPGKRAIDFYGYVLKHRNELL